MGGQRTSPRCKQNQYPVLKTSHKKPSRIFEKELQKKSPESSYKKEVGRQLKMKKNAFQRWKTAGKEIRSSLGKKVRIMGRITEARKRTIEIKKNQLKKEQPAKAKSTKEANLLVASRASKLRSSTNGVKIQVGSKKTAEVVKVKLIQRKAVKRPLEISGRPEKVSDKSKKVSGQPEKNANKVQRKTKKAVRRITLTISDQVDNKERGRKAKSAIYPAGHETDSKLKSIPEVTLERIALSDENKELDVVEGVGQKPFKKRAKKDPNVKYGSLRKRRTRTRSAQGKLTTVNISTRRSNGVKK